MSTNIIYVVLRLETAAPALKRSLTRPYFEWAAKIPSDKAFTQTEDSTTNTYDVDEVEDTSGEKWKLKLTHDKSLENDVSIAGHSLQVSIAKQHLVHKAKELIKELREKGAKVEGVRKKKIEEIEDVNELNSYEYVARERWMSDDGAIAVRTKYWWEVVAVMPERKEIKAQV